MKPMQLKRMRVKNFSAFKETDWIEFSPGINLIVGQNNAGKSALLCLFVPFNENRHRNTSEYLSYRLEASEVEFDIEVSGRELEDASLKRGQQFWWPVQNSSDLPYAINKFREYMSGAAHILEVAHGPNQPFRSRRSPSHGQYDGASQASLLVQIVGGHLEPTIDNNTNDDLMSVVDRLWQMNLFSFKAERYSIGRCPWGAESERLGSNASNLPAVLDRLYGDQPDLFRRLVRHLCEVFSTIGNLSVSRSESTNELEILVWPTEEQSKRELAFGLNDCGTGVAQAIAILTVALTFQQALIIIDEISSFLHPAATKALLRILQTHFPQHQYIVATHSPEVLSAGNPATVHVVRRDGYDSSVKKVNLRDIDQLRDVADDLGISMTDVFAAEKIIWVEGRTEELCFPFIYEKAGEQLPRGVMVASVVNTGDFFAKRTKELIFRIYERVHQAASPLIKSATFGFDREKLTDDAMGDLEKRAPGRLLFLPRRHFECFLLDPAAIAAFIKHQVPDLASAVTPDEVEGYLQSVGGDHEFEAAEYWKGNISDERWLAEVNAAKLLKETCYHFTSNRLTFSKTHHSLELLQHILEHNQVSLGKLIDYVKELYELAQRDGN
jgi:predicted ATPase